MTGGDHKDRLGLPDSDMTGGDHTEPVYTCQVSIRASGPCSFRPYESRVSGAYMPRVSIRASSHPSDRVQNCSAFSRSRPTTGQATTPLSGPTCPIHMNPALDLPKKHPARQIFMGFFSSFREFTISKNSPRRHHGRF